MCIHSRRCCCCFLSRFFFSFLGLRVSGTSFFFSRTSSFPTHVASLIDFETRTIPFGSWAHVDTGNDAFSCPSCRSFLHTHPSDNGDSRYYLWPTFSLTCTVFTVRHQNGSLLFFFFSRRLLFLRFLIFLMMRDDIKTGTDLMRAWICVSGTQPPRERESIIPLWYKQEGVFRGRNTVRNTGNGCFTRAHGFYFFFFFFLLSEKINIPYAAFETMTIDQTSVTYSKHLSAFSWGFFFPL